jgi:hypothetical protein
MKFSLKVMLVGLCIVGAFAGMMGNWLIREPEKFFVAINLCATVLPFVLATGTIIWLGIKRERRRELVAWGVFLLLMPILVRGTVSLLWPRQDPLRLLSDERLIETRLPNRINEPWIWDELERRLSAGDLSKEEVDAAVGQLISHMKTARPQGWQSSLPWQKDFIVSARQARLLSDETFFALCDAFFGTQPVLPPINPIFKTARQFPLGVDFGNPFSNLSGLSVDLLWQVAGATIDGKPVTLEQIHKSGQNWRGRVLGEFSPGDHELKIKIECAYVDSSSYTAMNVHSLPIEQWPKALKRWKLEVTTPIKVEPKPNGAQSK